MKHSEKISTVTLDDNSYDWSIRHWPSWCWSNESFRGLSLLIHLSDANKRHLIVNFPMVGESGRRKPLRQQPRIPDSKIIECIQHAVRLGWVPTSRGKAFLMEVDDEPEEIELS